MRHVNHDDQVWARRSRVLAPWLWQLAYSDRLRKVKSRAALHAYCGLLRAHRWCWVNGVRL